MATIIDSLMVTLGFDVADYKKGQKEVSDAQKKMRDDTIKTQKDMEAGNKKVVEGLTSLKTGLLEIIGLFAAGIGLKDFVLGTMNSQAALGRLSTNLNMNAADLKAWGIVAEESGGKAEDAYNSLMTIQQGLGEAMANGHSAFTDTARRMGIGITDDMVKNQDYVAILQAVATRLQSLPRPLAQYDAAQLGVGGMFNAMMDPHYLKNFEEARKVVGVTDQSTKAAERLQKQWTLVQERFSGIKDKAWAALEPQIEKFVNWLNTIDWNKVVKSVNDTVAAFGGWKNVAIILGGVLALKVLSPVLGLVGGLGRLIPLLASTTAGLWAMVAAGAAVAGYGIGTAIWKSIEGTKAGDATGSFVAHVASAFGSQDATDAILSNDAKGDTDPERIKNLAALYRVRQAAGSLPRGIRNNNPGNLNYVGQTGAHLEYPGGRFAAFNSMPAGIAALQSQLERYIVNGTDTIRKIVNKYAPAGDHNDVAAYIKAMMKDTGDSADQSLGAKDVPALIRGIINHENGKGYVSDTDISSGLQYGARQRAMARGTSNSKTVSNDVRISQLTVQTQATDAQGIAKDLPKQLQNNALLASVDTGAE